MFYQYVVYFIYVIISYLHGGFDIIVLLVTDKREGLLVRPDDVLPIPEVVVRFLILTPDVVTACCPVLPLSIPFCPVLLTRSLVPPAAIRKK